MEPPGSEEDLKIFHLKRGEVIGIHSGSPSFLNKDKQHLSYCSVCLYDDHTVGQLLIQQDGIWPSERIKPLQPSVSRSLPRTPIVMDPFVL